MGLTHSYGGHGLSTMTCMSYLEGIYSAKAGFYSSFFTLIKVYSSLSFSALGQLLLPRDFIIDVTLVIFLPRSSFSPPIPYAFTSFTK